jgi:hypothetical protein
MVSISSTKAADKLINNVDNTASNEETKAVEKAKAEQSKVD